MKYLLNNKLIIVLGVLFMAISLFGCSAKEPVECGGKVDNSYNAPKEIKSKNIVEFSAYFYVESDDSLDDDYTSQYDFKIKDNVLSEDIFFKISETIDDSVLKELQEIIDKYELVKMNGTDCYTAGLPPEYQPYYFKVIYDSGEKLYFSENNNPQSEWAKEIVELFRKTFINLGHKEFEPSVEALSIDRFRFDFNVDNLAFSFFPITMEDDKVELMETIHSLDDSGIKKEELADITDELYDELSQLLIDLNLKRFHTGSLAVNNDCPHTKNGYYEIYIDFKNGKQIYGYSSNEEEVEDFKENAKELVKFFDTYMDNHNRHLFK